MSAESFDRLAAPPPDVRERLPGTDERRPFGRLRRRQEPEAFPQRAPLEFGAGAGRLGMTLGRALLTWPGRDPLRRSERR